jgi:hypothetical protein
MALVDLLPRDVGVDEAARREKAHVVEHRHRLALVHLRSAGIDDLEERRDPHPHRGARPHVRVQRFERNAVQGGLDVEEARRVVEELVLLGSYVHPGGVGSGPHLSAKRRPEVAYVRPAHDAHAPEVGLE